MTIEKAVEIIENELEFTAVDFGKAVGVLYNLGKEYIGIKGLSEKAELEGRGFNEALHLCKLVMMKEYVRKDKIEKDKEKMKEVIQGKLQELSKCSYIASIIVPRAFEKVAQEIAQALAKADIIKVKEEKWL